MTITITIQRESVVGDLRVKSHLEAAAISDAEERYIVQAGTEKTDEINQCVTDAFSELSAIVRPLVSAAASLTGNDNYRSAGDLVLDMEVSSRRGGGLAAPLADALHKYAVDAALAKFYRDVSRPALAETHERMIPSDKANIDVLLFTKQEPSY